ncbi:MAG: lysophospholipid acyltransferase family protein [bacterium]
MVYWISCFLFRIIVQIFFRGKCYGRDNLPEKGPYIAIINHSSLFDIPALAMVVRGKVTTMVKDSLFQVPILNWWLRAVHMFPVKRGQSDEQAFNHAAEMLKKGFILFMSPEGTRKYDPANPPRAHTGFIRLAQIANCPVVPIAITGTRDVLPPGAKFPKFVQIKTKVGKQIQFEKVAASLNNREKLQKQANEAMQKVYQLRKELNNLH